MSLIELDNLSLGYGRHLVLDNVSAGIEKGCLAALVGRNGCGKSTLLRALAAIDKPLSGKILIDGKDIHSLDLNSRAKLVSVVTTQRVRIPNMKCRSIVEMGRAPYTGWSGTLSALDLDIVDKAMRLVEISDFANRPIDTLSDGECQRVMIARALAQDTPVILLDEPTSFLDMPGRLHICSILEKLAVEHHRTILFSTHELQIVLHLCNEILLIDNKSLTCGSPSEIYSNQAFKEIFCFPWGDVNV